MFDEQFHQFIASRTALPLPFSSTTFDASFPSNQTILLQYPLQKGQDEKEEEERNRLLSSNLELDRERSEPKLIDPWSNDEVLALLRIRSSMENWFPDFTWEHVSRKLGEIGFKRSAEKCKERYEEESRYFTSINYCKNVKIFSELEEFYNGGTDPQVSAQKDQLNVDKPENKSNPSAENDKAVEKSSKSKKRKREQKFEMLKRLCEDIVDKMLAQQEELNTKLIEDMVKREEEMVAREEAWKKQEMDRIDKEIQIRAHEQAIAGDRQSIIIDLLNKFTSSANSYQNPNPNPPTSLTETLPSQNPIETLSQNNPQVPEKNPKSTNTQKIKLQPPSSSTYKTPENPNFDREDHGKRWPRDEVLSLINLRCTVSCNGEDKEGSAKGPLWERISQGMLELGYKRSAKRCKEKWENINKYFRKTKDVNKKRSVDSRTCPYFHQLSTLYNQGKLVAPSEGPENCFTSSENRSTSPENQSSFLSSHGVPAGEGETNAVQAPEFDFEF